MGIVRNIEASAFEIGYRAATCLALERDVWLFRAIPDTWKKPGRSKEMRSFGAGGVTFEVYRDGSVKVHLTDPYGYRMSLSLTADEAAELFSKVVNRIEANRIGEER